MMNSLPKKNGFGLIELLVCIAVAAILASVAVPSMMDSIQNSKMKSLLRELTSSIQVAQSEAIKQGVQVTIRPHRRKANEWWKGWNIFTDANRDGLKNGNDTLIQTVTIESNGARLISAGGEFSKWLAFLPIGATNGNNGSSGAFNICRADGSSEAYWVAVIQASGNVITEKGISSCL